MAILWRCTRSRSAAAESTKQKACTWNEIIGVWDVNLKGALHVLDPAMDIVDVVSQPKRSDDLARHHLRGGGAKCCSHPETANTQPSG